MSAMMPKTRRIDIVGFLIVGGLTLITLLQVIQPGLAGPRGPENHG